jgi:hypothetical protein
MKGFDQVVQAIEAAQHRTLTATRGANKCRNSIFGNFKVDIPNGFETAVIDIKILCTKDGFGLTGG